MEQRTINPAMRDAIDRFVRSIRVPIEITPADRERVARWLESLRDVPPAPDWLTDVLDATATSERAARVRGRRPAPDFPRGLLSNPVGC